MATVAAGICIFEVVVGIMVLIGARPKLANWSLMLMIVFFTFLTFYSAYYNKVTDCGCFGDAIKLTPWGSFRKDLILLFFISILFIGEKHIKALLSRKMENMFLAIVTFFCFAFVVHTYRHLPVKDFRPYAVGNNITEGMKTCNELELACAEEAYYYVVKNKATGEVSEMLSTDYQDKWEEFDFVEATDKTIVLQEGYEPPIHDFSISKDEQARRFKDIKASPVKKWKFSAVDEAALGLWDDYSDYKTKMFEKTNTEFAPWLVIKANKKMRARVEVIQKLLEIVPYASDDSKK